MSFKRLKGKICLDIGCGERKQPGFLGMDMRKLPGVDLVHDAEMIPWPIKSGIVSLIMMSHLIEHIKPWKQIDVMNEAWRVLETDGLLLISTPYGGSFRYHQDPTHCSPWNEATIQYFQKGTPLYDIYKPSPWQVDKLTYHVNADLEVAFRKLDDTKESAKVEEKTSH